MPICDWCGRKIKFVTLKNGSEVPAYTDKVSIVIAEGEDTFVVNGEVVNGRRAKPEEQSQIGYAIHKPHVVCSGGYKPQ